MRALLLGLALAVAACGPPETCQTTACCDQPDSGIMLCANPSKTYQTCGWLGSTVIDLHVNGQSCTFDTNNVCDPGADICLKQRDIFCGIDHTKPPICSP